LLQEHIVKDGDKFSDRINPKGREYGLVFNDNSIWKSTAIDYSQEIVTRWKEQGANKTPVDLTMGIMELEILKGEVNEDEDPLCYADAFMREMSRR
ncbi:hypothetical protein PMAYCL1PPCAC_24610, partial [Pristionchus mayeri]